MKFLRFSLVSALALIFAFSPVLDVVMIYADAPQYNIEITDKDEDGINISISGTATGGPVAGKVEDHFVSIQWISGDNSTWEEDLPISFSTSTKDSFVGTWSAGPHVYSGTASTTIYTVKAIVHHGNRNGNESGEAVDTISVTVTPPPTDVCPNIDGDQTEVPPGKQIVDGNCVDIVVQPETGSLTVVKNVVGGSKQASDFILKVDGFVVTNNQATTTSVGAHTVSEDFDANYVATFSQNCPNGQITVSSSTPVTCTITNTYTEIPVEYGTLVVKKVANNDVDYSIFKFSINQDAEISFDMDGQNEYSYASGTVFSVVESPTANWTATSTGCNGTIVGNSTSTCTITNTFTGGGNGTSTATTTTGTLIVKKNVLASNGDSDIEDSTSFTVRIGGLSSSVSEIADAIFTNLAPGNYSVTEDTLTGYDFVSVSSSSASVLVGATTTVTVTNKVSTATSTSTTTPVIEEEEDNGGGGSSGGRRRNTGEVLGLTFGNGGQVLGANSCAASIDSYIKFGNPNDVEDVTTLQGFLNEQLGSNLPLTGFYGPLTRNAVNQFQLMYPDKILKPWVDLGLHTSVKVPTGYVFKLTQWWANSLLCSNPNAPMPILP